eukprot:jgi/Picsp_1/3236/NSC_06076-R1_---NA---
MLAFISRQVAKMRVGLSEEKGSPNPLILSDTNRAIFRRIPLARGIVSKRNGIPYGNICISSPPDCPRRVGPSAAPRGPGTLNVPYDSTGSTRDDEKNSLFFVFQRTKKRISIKIQKCCAHSRLHRGSSHGRLSES